MEQFLILQAYLCLLILFFACVLKIGIMRHLCLQYNLQKIIGFSFIMIFIVLSSQLITDISWILFFMDVLFAGIRKNFLFRCWMRLSWILVPLQYQALAYLIESLANPGRKINLRQKICGLFSITLSLIAFGCFITSPGEYYEFEFSTLRPIMNVYTSLGLLIPSFFITLLRFYFISIPLVLQKQIATVLKIFSVFLICDAIEGSSFLPSLEEFLATYRVLLLIPPTILTAAIVYYAFRLKDLRFLNMTSHVTLAHNPNSESILQTTLIRLSEITTVKELIPVIETFLTSAFSITPETIQIGFSNEASEQKNAALAQQIKKTSAFLRTHPEVLESFLQKRIVLTHQELHFSLLYQHNKLEQSYADLLELLSGDIFLPIIDRGNFFGFVLISRNARPHMLYSKHEQELLLILSLYVGQLVGALYYTTSSVTRIEYQKLQHELHEEHQRILKLHEGFKNLIRANAEREVGVVFYKNGNFQPVNREAETFLQHNLNLYKGHPLAISLSTLARKVITYKQSKTVQLQDGVNNFLSCYAIATAPDTALLMLYKPHIADVITPQLLALSDPNQLDYLLSLQTTASGKLLQELFPTYEEPFLSLKISLLKSILSNRALWINGPQEDLFDLVQILHQSSLRQTLYIMTVTEKSVSEEVETQLFGQEYPTDEDKTIPLLQKLDKHGTLFLRNIDYLPLKLQERIARFLESSVFERDISKRSIFSDVKIICSGSKPFKILISERRIHGKLAAMIEETTVTMPTISELSQKTREDLIKGIVSQLIKVREMNDLLFVQEKDTQTVLEKMPLTLRELRASVQSLITKRSKKFVTNQEGVIESLFTTDQDQIIIQAARLGKNAKHDRELIEALWLRFKNQQKIAEILRVNRSSVSRMLKKFGMKDETKDLAVENSS